VGEIGSCPHWDFWARQAIAARMKALPENGTVLLETSLRGVNA